MNQSTSFYYLTIIFLIITLFSCGDSEDEIIFVGEYQAKSLTFTQCDDPSQNNTVVNVDANDRFCNPNNNTECFDLTVRLFDDLTYERIFVDHIISGGAILSTPHKTTGSYITEGSMITFTNITGNEANYNMSLDASQTQLSYPIQGTLCVRTYNIFKQ